MDLGRQTALTILLLAAAQAQSAWGGEGDRPAAIEYSTAHPAPAFQTRAQAEAASAGCVTSRLTDSSEVMFTMISGLPCPYVPVWSSGPTTQSLPLTIIRFSILSSTVHHIVYPHTVVRRLLSQTLIFVNGSLRSSVFCAALDFPGLERCIGA